MRLLTRTRGRSVFWSEACFPAVQRKVTRRLRVVRVTNNPKVVTEERFQRADIVASKKWHNGHCFILYLHPCVNIRLNRRQCVAVLHTTTTTLTEASLSPVRPVQWPPPTWTRQRFGNVWGSYSPPSMFIAERTHNWSAMWSSDTLERTRRSETRKFLFLIIFSAWTVWTLFPFFS